MQLHQRISKYVYLETSAAAGKALEINKFDMSAHLVPPVLMHLVMPALREHSAIRLISLISPSVKLAQRDLSVQEALEGSRNLPSPALLVTIVRQGPSIQCSTSVQLAHGVTKQAKRQKRSVSRVQPDGSAWWELRALLGAAVPDISVLRVRRQAPSFPAQLEPIVPDLEMGK
uniref:Uncharacterized protein n=1 Tax=Sphaerodactylus townsendi TaxID=933632 RepID=A0ACB8EY47_9SAUR